MRRSLGLAVLSAAATLTTTAALVGIGSPAIASVGYNGACGSGYYVIDSHDTGNSTMYLTYNYGNGNNCAVTIKSTNIGTPTYTFIGISRQSDNAIVIDPPSGSSRRYSYFAGPVYLYAAGTCISWGGGQDPDFWGSGWVHCR